MTFASLEFGALLLTVLGLFYFLPQRGRMSLMLLASYAFYCAWNPVYGILILASTLLDYGVALYLHRTPDGRKRKLALLASVSGNLGILAYFKYTDFALDSLRMLLGPLGEGLPGPLHLVLPVGISFYTFQTMSYTIDVYRRELTPERDFLSVALYVAFFPQLVAGPIERARDLLPQLQTRQPFSLENLEEGGRVILWGFLKKLVVADRLTAAAFPVYQDPTLFDSIHLAFGVVAMFVVIYLDFSAYSEIATGTARLFGVRLSRNFDFPHVSLNIAEFWRRWHMTMSSWVRDYLFMPLGGFHPRNLRVHARVMLITMGLVGLWHGASLTFVLWGLAHGFCLVIYHLLYLRVLRKHRKSRFLNGRPWRLGAWTANTLLRVVLSILFFSPSLVVAGLIVKRIAFAPTIADGSHLHVLLGGSVLIGFWTWHYLHFRVPMGGILLARHPATRAALYALGATLVFFGAVEHSEPFIYYQF